MNESETRAELIDPKLKACGWGVIEDSKILPQQFLFTELEDLKVIGDTRVEVSEIVKTFSPDFNHNVGCYRQEVVSEHRFWRARIEFVNFTLWLSVPVEMDLSVSYNVLLNVYYVCESFDDSLHRYRMV
jgi:hypothetical protein